MPHGLPFLNLCVLGLAHAKTVIFMKWLWFVTWPSFTFLKWPTIKMSQLYVKHIFLGLTDEKWNWDNYHFTPFLKRSGTGTTVLSPPFWWKVELGQLSFHPLSDEKWNWVICTFTPCLDFLKHMSHDIPFYMLFLPDLPYFKLYVMKLTNVSHDLSHGIFALFPRAPILMPFLSHDRVPCAPVWLSKESLHMTGSPLTDNDSCCVTWFFVCP